jgi:hypothetical protein
MTSPSSKNRIEPTLANSQIQVTQRLDEAMGRLTPLKQVQALRMTAAFLFENASLEHACFDRENSVSMRPDWETALDLFHAGDPTMLSHLVRTSHQIPPHIKNLLADLVQGQVHCNTPPGKKSRLNYLQKKKVVEELARLKADTYRWRKKAEEMADLNGDEPCEILKMIAGYRNLVISLLAQEFGVSPSVIVKTPQRFRPVL